MGIGLHGASQSLLADERECVSIVHNNETNGVRFGMRPFTEISHLVTDSVNTAVFFTREPKNAVNIEGRFRFQEVNYITQERGLTSGALACEKEMGKVVKTLTYRLKEGSLADKARFEDGSHW